MENVYRRALQQIAEHHEAQRIVWANECGDADQARYHEERRNFALSVLAVIEVDEEAWETDFTIGEMQDM